MQILQNKKLIIMFAVVALGAGSFVVYKYVLKKPAPVVVKKEVVKKDASKPTTPTPATTNSPKEVDYTKYKTLEVLKVDIATAKKGGAPVKLTEFFNNDKKEMFVFYELNGAVAVAKLDPTTLKWSMVQEWNGSPDCAVFDKAGVPKAKTVQFECYLKDVKRK